MNFEIIYRQLHSHEITKKDYAREQRVPEPFLDLLIEFNLHSAPSLQTVDDEQVFDTRDFGSFEWYWEDDGDIYEKSDVQVLLDNAVGKRLFSGEWNCKVYQAIVEGLLSVPIALNKHYPFFPYEPVFDKIEIDALLRDHEKVNGLINHFN
ncbi:hypothetical protein N9L06_01015 [Mariniblastus sp.]|nr:hypothetical protein [Mariniblastus sp.]